MKNLLIAQDLKPLMLDTMSFLQRSDIDVRTAASNEDILRHHLESAAHLIVTRPGLPGMACETLFNIIRRGESMKRVSLLLLSDGSPLHTEIARRCSANAVVTKPVDTGLFASRVRELLDVPPRQSYRVLLNITVEGRHNNRPVMCNSVNVSTGGMLVRAKEAIAKGDRIVCSFYLPDGRKVSAQGEVARSFRQNDAPDVTFYGIRFRSFDPGSEAAIAAFVEREQGRLQATRPVLAVAN